MKHIDNSKVEYFFKKSFVTYFEETHSRKIKNEKNLIIDHDDTDYLRVMKLFNDSNQTTKVRNEQLFNKFQPHKLIDDINKKFYCRCWLPKNIIGTKGKKIEKVVILFNGLNETEHFHLYDLLGSFFSENGYGAILLPTPLHLNRRVIEDGKIKKPTSYVVSENNHMLFYHNFLKSKLELDYIIEKILKRTNDKDEDFNFYTNYFDGVNTKIYLVGYSLGGLRALSYFLDYFIPLPEEGSEILKEEEYDLRMRGDDQKVKACITLNSGPGIYNTDVTELGIGSNDWKTAVEKCAADVCSYKRLLDPGSKERELVNLFECIYFSDDLVSTRSFKNKTRIESKAESTILFTEKIEHASDYYLAVSGGSDSIVRINQIQQLLDSNTKKFNQFIVGKGDHFISHEKSEWHEYLPSVEKIIIDFFEMSSERHYTAKGIVDNIKKFFQNVQGLDEIGSRMSKESLFTDARLRQILKLLPDNPDKEFNKDRFLKYYYRSKFFYPRFNDLIKKIYSRK